MKQTISKILTRSTVTGLVLAMAGTASAGTINYDFRADASYLKYSVDTIPSSSRFFLKTGRLDYKANLNESLSFETRLAFNKSAGTAQQTRDSLSNAVELAFISHKMSDNFVLHMGKFNTEIGGFEGATSGADLYLISPMYQHTAAGNTPNVAGNLAGANFATNSSTNNLLYSTGVKGTIGFMENQTLSLVATNNTADAVEGGNFNQNRGLYGAVYKGAFMDKTLSALLSYHEVTPQAPGAVGKHTFIAAGVKVDMLPWAGILEYQTTEFKPDASTLKDNLNVVIGKLAYNFGQWTPRLEAFTGEEKREIGATETNRFTGVGAVLEYKPTEDNFRYHIAYTTIDNRPANSANDLTRTEIVVGARLLGDFLK